MATLVGTPDVAVTTSGLRFVVGDAVLSNDYVAGSETLDLSAYLGTVKSFVFSADATGTAANTNVVDLDYANFDSTNSTVSFSARAIADGAATAANTNLSTVSIHFIAAGTMVMG